MSIDELKTAWQEYDRKLQFTRELSEKMVVSMINERSRSRLSKIRKQYIFGFLYMTICLFLGIAVLAGNPFDYHHIIEYVPIGMYCICMVILVMAMIKTYSELQRVAINQMNLDASLKKIIDLYERPIKFLHWTLKVLLLSTTILFPLSFLPRKIVQMGLWTGIGDTCIAMAISIAVVFIAYKLGAFKERRGKRFKEDLNELNELKGLSKELMEN